MNRRGFLAAGLAGIAGGAALSGSAFATTAAGPMIAADHPLQAAWTAWKALCLRTDGRIVDSFQNGASHSEGQGYGLTLAAAFGDDALETFNELIDLLLRQILPGKEHMFVKCHFLPFFVSHVGPEG